MLNQLGRERTWVSYGHPMGHNKGKDNAKKRAVRRKKNDRIVAAADAAKAGA